MYSQYYNQGTPGGYSQYYNSYNQGLLRSPQQPMFSQQYSMPDVSGQGLTQSVSGAGVGGPVSAAVGPTPTENQAIGLESHGSLDGSKLGRAVQDFAGILGPVSVTNQSKGMFDLASTLSKAGKATESLDQVTKGNAFPMVQTFASIFGPQYGMALGLGKGVYDSYQAGLLGDMLDSRSQEGLLDAYEDLIAANSPWGLTDYEAAAQMAAADRGDGTDYEGYDSNWGGYAEDTYDLDYGSADDGMDDFGDDAFSDGTAEDF